ncbi:hypothetical protein PSENEW3n2_00000839 [Picochlorum sp. SENEW3]|nr:hypothetical protein PSENEW3n2_00000839 [Picochlorum sp. SENEW3]WPT15761.1 hypothetical protein PSENEW3_00000839 [Picochlorum sp. SENEW3]
MGYGSTVVREHSPPRVSCVNIPELKGVVSFSNVMTSIQKNSLRLHLFSNRGFRAFDYDRSGFKYRGEGYYGRAGIKWDARRLLYSLNDDVMLRNLVLSGSPYRPFLDIHHGNETIQMGLSEWKRAGGENLGSVFYEGEDIVAFIRFNVPYNPLSWNGHGYRSLGIYHLEVLNNTVSAIPVRWVARDDCVSDCIKLNEIYGCLSTDLQNWNGSFTPGLQNIEIPSRIESAKVFDFMTNPTNNACIRSINLGIKCAHRCRMGNQVYQANVSRLRSVMFAVVPLRNNVFYGCIYLNKTMDGDCFSTPLVEEVGRKGHPMSSPIIDFENHYHLFVVNKNSSCPLEHVRWESETFSRFETKERESQGTLVLEKVRFPFLTHLSIGFTEVWKRSCLRPRAQSAVA